MDTPDSPQAHFTRAKSHLSVGTTEALLYGALEFRYCVESQLKVFADTAAAYVKKRGNPWSAKELGRHVDGVFGPENTYSIEVWTDSVTDPVNLTYVPVSQKIRKLLGQIDNFLHHEGASTCYVSGKSTTLRILLEEGVSEMETVLTSGLLGSLVMEPHGILNFILDLKPYPTLARAVEEGETLHMTLDIAPYVAIQNDDGTLSTGKVALR
jgi:hypothetical protein